MIEKSKQANSGDYFIGGKVTPLKKLIRNTILLNYKYIFKNLMIVRLFSQSFQLFLLSPDSFHQVPLNLPKPLENKQK